MKNDPAFPTASRDPQSASLFGGLTKRELFAAMAMQAHLTGLTTSEHPALVDEIKVALFPQLWVAYADALITELERKE